MQNYLKAFEVVTGDTLYLAGPVFNILTSHHKYAACVLKDERRHLFEEGLSLSKITEPIEYEDNKTYYPVFGSIQCLINRTDIGVL